MGESFEWAVTRVNICVETVAVSCAVGSGRRGVPVLALLAKGGDGWTLRTADFHGKNGH